jgi:hypothetical protein
VKSGHKLVGADLAVRRHGRREHRRPPQGRRSGEDVWQSGMNPELPRPGGPRQPVPVHRLQVRLHPRGPRHHLRRTGLGGRGSSGGTRHRPGLRRGARARARRARGARRRPR